MTVTIEYNPGQLFTGQTVTGTAYLRSSGNATGTALTFTEDSNRPGFYRVTTGALTAGLNEITTSLGDVGYVNVVDGTTVTMDPSPLMASITIPATATLLTANQAGVVPSSGGPLALKSDVQITVNPTVSITVPPSVGTSLLTASQFGIVAYSATRLTFTGLGTITGRSALWLTIKNSINDPDSAALVMISESAGLIYANGAAASDSTKGSLTVTDATAGNVAFYLDEIITGLLTPTNGKHDVRVCDLKWRNGADAIQLGVYNVVIVGGVTRAV